MALQTHGGAFAGPSREREPFGLPLITTVWSRSGSSNAKKPCCQLAATAGLKSGHVCAPRVVKTHLHRFSAIAVIYLTSINKLRLLGVRERERAIQKLQLVFNLYRPLVLAQSSFPSATLHQAHLPRSD